MMDKEFLRKQIADLEQMRGELIMAKYRYEEALEDFDAQFGKGAASKAIHALRSRALLKKLELTREALNSVTEELFDSLNEEA